ncbi:hypothetical protein PsYK624_013670 [Phanerochaete sordida]|uniref:Uncharacterized protein n=1 Tax=Phanerochaete sordida TaxID=48140 RepID=A0A9P3L8R9_9APHY|nr:hypothetical protein PsYK624_013670 [Phanerochaete sordida]
MATFDTIASPADVIAESLPSILVSRFLMNLRQIDTEGTEHSRNTPSQMSDVEFTVPRSMLGNLGEPLDDTPSPTVDTESTIVQVVPEASDKEPQSAVEDLGSLPYGENIEEVAREV